MFRSFVERDKVEFAAKCKLEIPLIQVKALSRRPFAVRINEETGSLNFYEGPSLGRMRRSVAPVPAMMPTELQSLYQLPLHASKHFAKNLGTKAIPPERIPCFTYLPSGRA